MERTESIAEASSDLLPDCEERKAKEESQGASEISNQGEERVEKDLLLHLGYARLRECRYNKNLGGA